MILELIYWHIYRWLKLLIVKREKRGAFADFRQSSRSCFASCFGTFYVDSYARYCRSALYRCVQYERMAPLCSNLQEKQNFRYHSPCADFRLHRGIRPRCSNRGRSGGTLPDNFD